MDQIIWIFHIPISTNYVHICNNEEYKFIKQLNSCSIKIELKIIALNFGQNNCPKIVDFDGFPIIAKLKSLSDKTFS